MAPRTAIGQGQQGSGSPYSAYGLGELVGSAQVSQALMGGASVALADPFSVIQGNPASYASLGAPVFETGLVHGYRRFATDDIRSRGTRTGLLGFTIGMPFGKNRWGLAFGLNPESQVGYSIRDQSTLPNGDKVDLEYSGTGGLNRVFVGLGHKIWLHRDSLGRGSHLSFGANMNYMFGSVSEIRKAYYPRAGDYYNTAVVTSTVLNAPVFSLGTQLSGDLVSEAANKARAQRKKERLIDLDREKAQEWAEAGKDPALRKAVKIPAGVPNALRYRGGFSVELPADLQARRDELVYSFVQGVVGVEFPLDTIAQVRGLSGTLGLPVQLAMGFTIYNAHWSITAEHRVRDWKQMKVNVEGVELASQLGTMRTSLLGASFRPAGMGNGSFLQNIIYRAGLRYTDDYLVVGGQQLQEIGMAFGMSLPLMGSTTRSRFSIGAEFGEQGSNSEGLIQERFAHLYVGITITPDIRDKWLQKRRIE